MYWVIIIKNIKLFYYFISRGNYIIIVTSISILYLHRNANNTSICVNQYKSQ